MGDIGREEAARLSNPRCHPTPFCSPYLKETFYTLLSLEIPSVRTMNIKSHIFKTKLLHIETHIRRPGSYTTLIEINLLPEPVIIFVIAGSAAIQAICH